GKVRGRLNVQRLVDAGEDSLVEKNFQKLFCAHIKFFREFTNGDAFGDGDVTRRTRLRWSDYSCCGTPISCTWPLPGWMKFALTFNLTLIDCWTLSLRRFASVKGLAGFSLRRHFVRHRRQHCGPAGHTWTRTRPRGNGTRALAERPIARTAR